MLLDKSQKKAKETPIATSASPLKTGDMSNQVPEVDDVLAEVDRALEKAEKIEQMLPARSELQRFIDLFTRACGCLGR